MESRIALRTGLISLALAIPGPHTQIGAQTIPSSDRVNWSVAGLYTGIPSSADTVVLVNLMSGTTWDDKVSAAISAAKAYVDANPSNWAVVYFPAGTITLSTSIVLDQDYRNIVLQGAGSDRTTLKFSFNGTNQNCVEIKGYDLKSSTRRELASDLLKGSASIQCKTSINYPTPTWIRLSEEDHDYHDEDSWAQGCVGQITRLESATGTTGTLKDAASKTYTEGNHTSIWRIVPVMNIGIENMTIKREDTGHPRGWHYWTQCPLQSRGQLLGQGCPL